jgi:HEAT repeat protein
MRQVVITSLAFLLAGCSGATGQLISHGQPVEHWLQELAKPDAKARKKAVVALGHVGTADSRAIPAVIGALKDPEAIVRDQAVLSLLNQRPTAKEALPALKEALNDKDEKVRSHAASALKRLEGSG